MSNILTELSIKRIQHTGIPVTDIHVSEAFYTKLGFTNVMQADFILEEKKGTCIMMQTADIIIELYQLPEHKLAEIKNRKDGHIDHIAFDVADIDKAFAVVKKAGYNIIEKEPVFLQFWKNGCKFFNITGPDGERLEFNQVL
jgi:catechol 2,3-dioxygenase-like lactoylglutathione lyase family enzyme